MNLKRYIRKTVNKTIRKFSDDSLDDLGPGGYDLFVWSSSSSLQNESAVALNIFNEFFGFLPKNRNPKDKVVLEKLKKAYDKMRPFLEKIHLQAKNRIIAWNTNKKRFDNLYKRDFSKAKIAEMIKQAEQYIKQIQSIFDVFPYTGLKSLIGCLKGIISAFKRTRPA